MKPFARPLLARVAPFALALVAMPLRAQITLFVPPENPQTPAKIVLGKLLFWEEQLSHDNSMACGTCHLPEHGGADGRPFAVHPGLDGLIGTADDGRGSPGVVHQAGSGDFTPAGAFALRRQATARWSPTNLGAGAHHELFWDGRADSTFLDPETGQIAIAVGGALESQALGPILSAVEMGKDGRTWAEVEQKLAAAVPLRLASALTPDLQAALQQSPSYPQLFQAAFGDPAITARRIAFALASYQRTLLPDDTPWDRYTYLGQTNALSAQELHGWQVFQTSGVCVACHDTEWFQDDQFHNLGLRWASEDTGRFGVTGVANERGAFKTPTLRNAGLRQRLFHNGQSPALDDPAQLTDPNSVLNVYLQGHGVDASNLDPFMTPIGQNGVTVADLQDVLAFVANGLTDQRAALRLPPFDHPDLRSLTQAPPRVYGQALAGAFEPYVVDTAPSFAGNLEFRLGFAGGDGGGVGLVTYGFASIEPNATVAGLPWNVDVFDYRLLALAGQPGEPGHATWHLPIPNDPTLQPLGFYFQLFVLDAQAPGGIAASKGTEFFVR